MTLALLYAVLALGVPRVAEDAPANDTLVVSTAWVAERLNDPSLVLIHVGRKADYDAGHLPGAQFLEFSQIAIEDENGLRTQLPPLPQLKAAFESLGITDHSRIVVYFGTNWVTLTARTFLTLTYLGLGSQTSMLDGGLPAWKDEGRPISTDASQITPGSFTPRPQSDVVTTAAWVNEHLNTPKVAVIDARTEEYYSGQRSGHGMPRAGHIPGAGNVPFTSVVDEETLKFKSKAELQELFSSAGVEPGDTVVTYCHIGQQASLVYLIARLLGHEARMYDGSFQEWSQKNDLPVDWPARSALPTLISTDELAELLATAEPAVVDVRSNLFTYLEGHLPGAAYLHYETLRVADGGVPAAMLPAESYAQVFSRLGIRKDRPVVLYTEGRASNFNATFVAWILAGFQLPNVYLLDGGYAKWQGEGKPITRQYPETESSTFSPEPFDPDVVALAMVQRSLNRDDVVIVDVRPPNQYLGQAGAQMRRGHIPGAINHVWGGDLIDQEGAAVWKPVEQLRASYVSQGITPDKMVLLYCNTGTEASHAYFALRNLLGYPNVRVYVPSWTEWAAREDLPIETGK